jgi:outer membrane lipoprotein carrier protein
LKVAAQRLFLAVVALSTTLTPAAFAAKTAPEAIPIVRALEERYRHARTLKAIFLERFSDGRRNVQLESGTVYFSKPGRMRWEYESPEQKLFVADGKTVWFFVPSDHTVTRAPMKESSDWRTPLVLLTGDAKLTQLCDQIDLVGKAPGAPGHVILRCLPRGEKHPAHSAPEQGSDLPPIAGPSQQFDQVLIEVDSVTGELADVRVLQPGAIELEYRFGNWQENLPLQESIFHFQAPIGVAIVDGSADLQAVP